MIVTDFRRSAAGCATRKIGAICVFAGRSSGLAGLRRYENEIMRYSNGAWIGDDTPTTMEFSALLSLLVGQSIAARRLTIT